MDLSEEEIESMLSYLLDLKKTGQKEPPMGPNVPTSLIRASVDQASQPVGSLQVLSTLKAKKKIVDELTAPTSIRKSSDNYLVPACSQRYTRRSAVPGKVVPSAPEIDSSPDQGHSDLEDDMILEARTTITSAVSPNKGVEQKSIENPAEIEKGKRVASVKPISSIKRKFFHFPSGSWRKQKCPFISTMAKTRMSSLDTGFIKGTSLRKEAAVALKPQSPGSSGSSPASSAEKEEKSALFIAVPNPEDINSGAILEGTQKVHSEHVSLNENTFSEILELAKKLVMANKRLEDVNIMLQQEVKHLKENRRLLTDTMMKAKQDALKGIEENTKLKDEIRDQKKMIDELSKQIESTQGSLVQKWAEVNRLKEEAAGPMQDKEKLQSRVSRAIELLQLTTSALCPGKGAENSAS